MTMRTTWWWSGSSMAGPPNDDLQRRKKQQCQPQPRQSSLPLPIGLLHKRHRRWIFAVLPSIAVLLLLCPFATINNRLWGSRWSWRGGAVGRRIDNTIKRYLFHRAMRQHRIDFVHVMRPAGLATAGPRRLASAVPVPNLAAITDPDANAVGTPVITNFWLVETLRHIILHKVQNINALDDPHTTCQPINSNQVLWLQPNVGSWYRPPPVFHGPPNLSVVWFDEASMEQIVQDTFPGLFRHAYRYLSQEDQVQLWALCAVYQHGGMFASYNVPRDGDRLHAFVTHILYSRLHCSDQVLTQYQHQPSPSHRSNRESDLPTTPCSKARATAALSLDLHRSTGQLIHLAATTAHHPYLQCLLDHTQAIIGQANRSDPSNITTPTHTILRSAEIARNGWRTLWDISNPDSVYQICSSQSANEEAWSIITIEDHNNHNDHNDNDKNQSPDRKRDPDADKQSTQRLQVTIVQRTEQALLPLTMEEHIDRAVVQTKQRRSQNLQHMNCSAGWICHRCLRMPWWGTLDACRLVCNSCYQQSMCQSGLEIGQHKNQRQNEMTVDVQVVESKNRGQRQQKRIPRIIHQTWFADTTTYNYPHLQRLQHSWKASGWDYRFYNDKDARNYIRQHYPNLFVMAYDSILPGAFKADLFRLLVLLRDGGVYADVDVQLEVNLDAFITQELSLFVPRDVPIDYWPESNYCLWNGLLGAAPGHPLIARAVQDILNRVLHRDDALDLESQQCQRIDAEIWKLRTFPILMITGPCALGTSFHSALGHANWLQGYPLGWLNTTMIASSSVAANTMDHDWGDILILLQDRYDFGEQRFTDIGRNLLVASTNADCVGKAGILPSLEQEQLTRASTNRTGLTNSTSRDDGRSNKSSLAHYSESESDIVGEFGIYKDHDVVDTMIRLVVSHSYLPE